MAGQCPRPAGPSWEDFGDFDAGEEFFFAVGVAQATPRKSKGWRGRGRGARIDARGVSTGKMLAAENFPGAAAGPTSRTDAISPGGRRWRPTGRVSRRSNACILEHRQDRAADGDELPGAHAALC